MMACVQRLLLVNRLVLRVLQSVCKLYGTPILGRRRLRRVFNIRLNLRTMPVVKKVGTCTLGDKFTAVFLACNSVLALITD